jgi:3-(3-hydroxy-phenyl)propionate hydroxylase
VPKIDAEVVIAGAGPVGLTAALALARRGVAVTVLEQLPEAGTFWRASTFHPPSLDVAADLGIVDRMLELGLIAPIYQLRDYRAGPVTRFDLDTLADETAWPFRLQLEQYKYSAIVAEALAKRPEAAIRFGKRVVSVVQDAEQVTAELADGDSVTARWLVAADGSGSTVRELAGVAFEGSSYPVRRLLLSIQEDLGVLVGDLDLVNYVYAPVGAGLVLRIPDLWRVMFSLPAEVDDEQAASPEYYGFRLKELLGVTAPVIATQVYHVHQRVAGELKAGRLLLAGDAAHVNSPSGGMGLNSGIHDAFDLAATLASARGQEHRALDAWAARRRAAAVDEVQRVAHQTTVELSEPDEVARLRKQAEVRAIAADPARTKEWLMNSSMISGVRRIPVGAARVAPRSRSFVSSLGGTAVAGGTR